MSEHERALVGAALAGYADIADLVRLVEPSDFDEPKLEIVWRAVSTVVAQGERVEIMRVVEALGSEVKQLPDGPVFLTNLAHDTPIVGSAPFYAEKVREGATRRRVRTAASRIHQLSTDPTTDLAQIREDARLTLDDALAAAGHTTELRRMSEVLPSVVDIAEHGRPDGMSTPWSSLDHIIGGLHSGRLVVVGARPGIGKSILGANVAHWVAKEHGRSVLFASMEMSREEVVQRIVAHHAQITLGHLIDGELTATEWPRFETEMAALAGLPLHIDDSAEQTVASIMSHATDIQRRTNDLGVIVVDYLQLMKVRDPGRSRAEQVGEISRGLKIMARKFNVPVIAMAQLNRENTKRAGGKPSLSDLRESGSIEADADVVILIHRAMTEEGFLSNRAELYVAKNRSGPISMTALEVWGHYARLAEIKPYSEVA